MSEFWLWFPPWAVMLTYVVCERAWALHKTGYHFQGRIEELEARLAALEEP
jgi:hypothetical protein